MGDAAWMWRGIAGIKMPGEAGPEEGTRGEGLGESRRLRSETVEE